MRVLLLSPYPEELISTLKNDEVVFPDGEEWPDVDYVVSYGYRRIIGGRQLQDYAGRMANIHISLLPWNRGADPNLWSWYDDTPKGVTIHDIDAGIDTGRIIAQLRLPLRHDETLASSYQKLRACARELFAMTWPFGPERHYQHSGGSFHRKGEATGWLLRFPLLYNTPVEEIMAMGRQMRGWS